MENCEWINLIGKKYGSLLCKTGYRKPTPIQSKAFPVITTRKNVVLISPTGTGKTEAALIPILYLMHKNRYGTKGIRVVYITPLRALNRDIVSRMRRLVELFGYTIAVRHGDTSAKDRKLFLTNPPTFMVTTPETFNLIMTFEKVRPAFSRVKWVVIDEIHELLDSKRGIELLLSLKRLEKIMGRKPRLIALSATLSRRSMRLVSEALYFPAIVIGQGTKEYEIKVDTLKFKGDFWKKIASYVSDISKEGGSTLVFVNTRQVAEKLGVELSKILGEDKVSVHHGSLHKEIREKAEKRFKEGEIRVLIATSSMELGIDIGTINTVVQIMSPRRATNLVQRVGRSGHFLDKTSKGYIITIPNLFEIMESLVLARRAISGDLEDLSSYKKPYDVLAHQITGMVLDNREMQLHEVYEIIRDVPVYRDLEVSELEEILYFLNDLRIIRYRAEEGKIYRSRRTHKYFYTVSMIPDEPDYLVIDIASREIIGKVSERFIVSNISKESPYFVLAGKIWRVVDIDLEKGKIVVQYQGVADARIPSWEGELIPVEYKVAREVCGLIQLLIEDPDVGWNILKRRFSHIIGKDTEQALKDILSKMSGQLQKLRGFSYRTPLIEMLDDGVIVYTCLGSKGNYTLGILLSSILSRIESVEFSRIPYALIFTSQMSSNMLARHLRDAILQLSKMDRGELQGLLLDHIRNTHAYRIRLSWIAKRMGVIEQGKRLTSEALRKLSQLYRGTVIEREVLNEMLIDNNDLNAVTEFLAMVKDSEESIKVIDGRNSSHTVLAEHVLNNPYMKRPETASGRLAMLRSIMIDAVRKRLENTEARLICLKCGYSWVSKPSEIETLSCPKCGGKLIAVTWRGDEESVRIVKDRLNGKRLKGVELKRFNELQRISSLLLTYSMDGLEKYAIQALLGRGIGPRNLPRVMAKLVEYGEREFYKGIIDEERKFVETRRYWKSS